MSNVKLMYFVRLVMICEKQALHVAHYFSPIGYTRRIFSTKILCDTNSEFSFSSATDEWMVSEIYFWTILSHFHKMKQLF